MNSTSIIYSPIPFWSPIVISKAHRKQVKMAFLGSLADLFFTCSSQVDKYEPSKKIATGFVLKPITVKIKSWSKASKIALSILTLGIVPLFLLVIKGLYRYTNRFTLEKTSQNTNTSVPIALPSIAPFQTSAKPQAYTLVQLQQDVNGTNEISQSYLYPSKLDPTKDYYSVENRKGSSKIKNCHKYLEENNFSNQAIEETLTIVLKSVPFDIAHLISSVNNDINREKIYKQLNTLSLKFYEQVNNYVFILNAGFLPETIKLNPTDIYLKKILKHIPNIIEELVLDFANTKNEEVFHIIKNGFYALGIIHCRFFLYYKFDMNQILIDCLAKLTNLHKSYRYTSSFYLVKAADQVFEAHYQKRNPESSKNLKHISHYYREIKKIINYPNSWDSEEIKEMCRRKKFKGPFLIYFILPKNFYGTLDDMHFLLQIPTYIPKFFGFFLKKFYFDDPDDSSKIQEETLKIVLNALGINKLLNKQVNSWEKLRDWEITRLSEIFLTLSEEQQRKFFPNCQLVNGRITHITP